MPTDAFSLSRYCWSMPVQGTPCLSASWAALQAWPRLPCCLATARACLVAWHAAPRLGPARATSAVRMCCWIGTPASEPPPHTPQGACHWRHMRAMNPYPLRPQRVRRPYLFLGFICTKLTGAQWTCSYTRSPDRTSHIHTRQSRAPLSRTLPFRDQLHIMRESYVSITYCGGVLKKHSASRLRKWRLRS